MNVLHVVNYFTGPRVFKNLATALDKLGIQQTIYTAFRGAHLAGENKPELKRTDSAIIYRPILSFYTRLNYLYKSKKITQDLQQHIQINDYDLIHAHTWYSDGHAVYNISKKYGKKYIVTVRNTDLNIFFKYFVHLRKKAKDVLLGAEKIIFISQAYKSRLLSHPYFSDIAEILKKKSVVIPNGINEFWLKNVYQRHPVLNEPARLLFVGKYDKGKNLLPLINIIADLNRGGIKCVLHTAGGGQGRHYNKIMQLINNSPGIVVNHGQISDKVKLMELYRASDIFIMPSNSETFGLVYVEALSQGIPVIFTKNEGIDGYFEKNIGEAVNNKDREEVKNAIAKIITNYSYYNFQPDKIVISFDWAIVAKEYESIYKEILYT
ncbi:MAG: glycosyltransferase family 4 protein [Chitinophagaceae bacterium]|nr:glycosyltransferase family 4 protein [Chitinophagaceae bacterium]